MATRSKIDSERSSPAAGRAVRGLAAALIFTLTGPALAQPSPTDKATAESLFVEGRKLMQESKFREACPKLEESQRLDPAAGTLLNLAVCHEGEGKLATAWSEFRTSLATARRESRADREKLASERIAAIEPRLPHLVVKVAPEARVAGLKIKLNGSALGEGAWGSSLAVDPGDGVIEAEAPGYQPWRTTVKIPEAKTIEAAVPALTPAPSQPVTTGPAGGERVEARGKPVAAYALLGVGVVGLGVGTFFGVRALGKKSDSDAECPGDKCTQRGVDLNDQAKTAARISDIGLGVGVLATAVGAVLLFTAPGSGEGSGRSTTSMSVGLRPLPGGGGASLGGSF